MIDIYTQQTVAQILGKKKDLTLKIVKGVTGYTNMKDVFIPERFTEDLSVFRGLLDHETDHVSRTDASINLKSLKHSVKRALNLLEDLRLDYTRATTAPGFKRNALNLYCDAVKKSIEEGSSMPQDGLSILKYLTDRFYESLSDSNKEMVSEYLKSNLDPEFYEEAKPFLDEAVSAFGTKEVLKIAEEFAKKFYKEPEDPESSTSPTPPQEDKSGGSGDEKDQEGQDLSDDERSSPSDGSSEGNAEEDKENGSEDNDSDDSEDVDKGCSSGSSEESEEDGDGKGGKADGEDEDSSDGEENEGSSSDGDENSEGKSTEDTSGASGEGSSVASETKARPGDGEVTEKDYKRIDVSELSDENEFYQEAKKTFREIVSSEDVYTVAPIEDYLVDHEYLLQKAKEMYPYNDIVKDMEDFIKEYYSALYIDFYRSFISMTRRRILRKQRAGLIDQRDLPDILTSPNIFYQKTNKRELDLAISLVIDLSGSMAGGMGMGKTKMYFAAAVMLLVGKILHSLHIPFEIWGFTVANDKYYRGAGDYTRIHALSHYHFKPFNVNFKKIYPVFNLMDGSYHIYKYKGHRIGYDNIDGESILFAAQSLYKRRESRKVMIVLSDGEPAGPIPMEVNNWLLKHAISVIRKAGMEIYGIGFTNPYVTDFYGEEYSVYAETPDELNMAFYKTVTDIIKARGGVR